MDDLFGVSELAQKARIGADVETAAPANASPSQPSKEEGAKHIENTEIQETKEIKV